jgi:hypothetical protein
MSQKITATHERGDTIPALIAPRTQMRVAAFLDTPFPVLREGPRESYDELITGFSKTNFHSHET